MQAPQVCFNRQQVHKFVSGAALMSLS